MIDKIKGAWEWIVVAVSAVGAFLLYGWWQQQKGAARAKAKMKVDKAEREGKRARAKFEAADSREDKAVKQAEVLETRRRRRQEEAAIELGRTREEIDAMSDEELADDLGRLLGGTSSGGG